MYFVSGEKFAKLGIKLGGEGLIVSEDKGGLLDVLDNISHSKSLTRARHTKQSLLAHARAQAARELRNCGRLIASGLIFRDKFKLRHIIIIPLKAKTDAEAPAKELSVL